jgi:hypothetical protein
MVLRARREAIPEHVATAREYGMNGITALSKVALLDFQHPVAPVYPVKFFSSV